MPNAGYERTEEQQIRDFVYAVMYDSTKKAALDADPDAFIAASGTTDSVQRVLHQMKPVFTRSFEDALPQSWWYK